MRTGREGGREREREGERERERGRRKASINSYWLLIVNEGGKTDRKEVKLCELVGLKLNFLKERESNSSSSSC